MHRLVVRRFDVAAAGRRKVSMSGKAKRHVEFPTDVARIHRHEHTVGESVTQLLDTAGNRFPQFGESLVGTQTKQAHERVALVDELAQRHLVMLCQKARRCLLEPANVGIDNLVIEPQSAHAAYDVLGASSRLAQGRAQAAERGIKGAHALLVRLGGIQDICQLISQNSAVGF